MNLKYKFVAVFHDGSQYEQNDQDVSITDNTRSCYYDIAERAKNGEIALFALIDGTNAYGVDLTTGKFAINVNEFRIHEEQKLTNMRLIFFRDHKHHFTQGDMKEIAHEITYRIGWQANDANGKNVQYTIKIE